MSLLINMDVNMRPMKVIIVEDEAIIAADIMINLQKMGHTVCSIQNRGSLLIESIRQEKVDLILLDIHLKGEMDGIEIAHIVNRNFNIPIIYITASTDQNTLDLVRETQYCGFLEKPINFYSLEQLIDKVAEYTMVSLN